MDCDTIEREIDRQRALTAELEQAQRELLALATLEVECAARGEVHVYVASLTSDSAPGAMLGTAQIEARHIIAALRAARIDAADRVQAARAALASALEVSR